MRSGRVHAIRVLPDLCGAKRTRVNFCSVAPRDLEDFWKRLATLDFPINRRSITRAVIMFRRDGQQRLEPSTISNFRIKPAGCEIRCPQTCALRSDTVSVCKLEQIHLGRTHGTGPPRSTTPTGSCGKHANPRPVAGLYYSCTMVQVSRHAG
jgi:hypothetical protein